MLQLFFAIAFSAAPLTLYVPPVRNFNLFVESLEGFLRQILLYVSRTYPRVRLGCSRILSSIRRLSRPS